VGPWTLASRGRRRADAAAGRWPGISFGNDPVLFHPDGGVIDAERAMTAMRELAAARGAQLHYESPVVAVEADQASPSPLTAANRCRIRRILPGLSTRAFQKRPRGTGERQFTSNLLVNGTSLFLALGHHRAGSLHGALSFGAGLPPGYRT
jgi:hypothetical protein